MDGFIDWCKEQWWLTRRWLVMIQLGSRAITGCCYWCLCSDLCEMHGLFLLDFTVQPNSTLLVGLHCPFTPEFEGGRSRSERGRKLKKLVVSWILLGPPVPVSDMWVRGQCGAHSPISPTLTWWSTYLKGMCCVSILSTWKWPNYRLEEFTGRILFLKLKRICCLCLIK